MFIAGRHFSFLSIFFLSNFRDEFSKTTRINSLSISQVHCPDSELLSKCIFLLNCGECTLEQIAGFLSFIIFNVLCQTELSPTVLLGGVTAIQ